MTTPDLANRRLRQADSLRLSGDPEAALEPYRQAQIQAQQAGDGLCQAQALAGLGECLMILGRHEEGLDVLEDARSVADLAGHPAIAARALGLKGRILAFQGLAGPAETALREALVAAEASEDPRAIESASAQLAQLLGSLAPPPSATNGPESLPPGAGAHAVPGPATQAAADAGAQLVPSGDFRVALLAAFAQELVGLPDVESLQERVLDLAMQIVQADHGLLLLLEDGRLQARVVRPEDPGEDWTYSTGIAQRVLASGEPFFAIDALSDPRLAARQSVMALALRTVVCVPLLAREDMLGVMYLDRKLVNEVFSTADLEVVTALAALAAQALVSARRIRDLEWQIRVLERELKKATG